jgi:hypothetical protein
MNVSSSIDYFYKKVIGTPPDDESNSDTELMMFVAALIHEHNERHSHLKKKALP